VSFFAAFHSDWKAISTYGKTRDAIRQPFALSLYTCVSHRIPVYTGGHITVP
jgi:hypothetical protein